MPVRERLLLVLPDKEIFDYLCTGCASSVGQREVTAGEKMSHAHINYATNSYNNTRYSHNSHSFNNTNSFNKKIVNIGVTDERSEILAWLSPLEPRIRHQDIRARRADNVGEWLLQTKEFRRWQEGVQENGSDHATLFCCGGPAVGKTYFR